MTENRKIVTMHHSLLDNSDVDVELDMRELSDAYNGVQIAEVHIVTAYRRGYEARYGQRLGVIDLHDLDVRTQPIAQPA